MTGTAIGTSLQLAQDAFIAALREREGLDKVRILDQSPRDAEDAYGEEGFGVVVFPSDEAEADIDVVVLCGPTVRFDEAYRLDFVVQVLLDGDNTDDVSRAQHAAQSMAIATLGELTAALAVSPTLGFDKEETSPAWGVVSVFRAVPAGWRQDKGWRSPNGAGCRFLFSVLVKDRITHS